MKLVVDEMPEKPRDCIFAEELRDHKNHEDYFNCTAYPYECRCTLRGDGCEVLVPYSDLKEAQR